MSECGNGGERREGEKMKKNGKKDAMNIKIEAVNGTKLESI